MSKKLNIVPLKELNLMDRFLFDEVMEDSQTHQDALSIVMGDTGIPSMPDVKRNWNACWRMEPPGYS